MSSGNLKKLFEKVELVLKIRALPYGFYRQ
nr:MAG TPA: hypothetical protein [Caudoviricetes sp.]DAR22357.1 MAG TPA: hypothetical protein [Caudoviricetes sp.]